MRVNGSCQRLCVLKMQIIEQPKKRGRAGRARFLLVSVRRTPFLTGMV
jgi:hypothetical protein